MLHVRSKSIYTLSVKVAHWLSLLRFSGAIALKTAKLAEFTYRR